MVQDNAPRRQHRAGRRFVVALLFVVLAFLAATSALFVWPATNQPRQVDVILSLNGADEAARESKAISLVEARYAPVLLFSQGNSPTPCPEVPRVKVVCFVAVPGRTVGEVRFAANYLKHHDEHSIIIVPDRAQATRARLLMDRCFSGQVLVVPASFQLLHFPFEVIYEWGALAKALLIDRHC
ncbi:MAG: YdcF family protein [Acidimicrobiales bacterium]